MRKGCAKEEEMVEEGKKEKDEEERMIRNVNLIDKGGVLIYYE